MRPSGAKPSSTRCAARKLASSRPAPTSSTWAMASSPTTITWCQRRTVRSPGDARPCLRRVGHGSPARSRAPGPARQTSTVASVTTSRERQHRGVHRDVAAPGQRRRCQRRPARRSPHTASPRPEQPARHRDHQRLGEQLAHQAPAAGAERDPRGQLDLPRGRLPEHQARDVGAADGEHQHDRQLQQQHQRPDAADDLLVQSDDVGAEPVIGVGMVVRQAGHDRARARRAPTPQWRRRRAGRGRRAGASRARW